MSTTYRSDIDGLRAIAVLSVVGFHAFPSRFMGGFVGVDVFFVISGFLISSVIYKGKKENEFTFTDFYARRIKRIFPALVVVLVACTIFGWLFLIPSDFLLLGKDVAAGAAFISNFELLQEQGYFDTAAELKPLLHLWSLGVEEQFYIVWPLLMALAWRKQNAPLVIAKIIFVVSFVLNVVLTNASAPVAFYIPVTRFWELMLGCILAIATLDTAKPSTFAGVAFDRFARLNSWTQKVAREATSWIGITFLVFSVLLINKERPFPGWWALMPTFGAILLILGGSTAWINRRMLAHPALVYIGLISYPLYLWHWPLLSFARLLHGGEPSTLTKTTCIFVSFILAELTYRFIEKPIRFRTAAHTSKTVFASIALATIGVVGVTIFVYDGLPSRFPVEIQNSIRDYSKASLVAYRNNVCFLNIDAGFSQFGKECEEFGQSGGKKIVLWGDSHAAQLFPGLEQVWRRDHAFDLVQYTASSCPPLFSFVITAHEKCTSINDDIAQKIALLIPDTVIMAGYWVAYYQSGDPEAIDEAIRQTVNRLKSMGVRRIIGIGQFPIWTVPPPRILSQIYSPFARISTSEPEELGHNKALLNWRAFDTDRTVKKAFVKAGATFVSPKSTLCNTEGCLLIVPHLNGMPMDWDTNHMTIAGSIFFITSNERTLLED